MFGFLKGRVISVHPEANICVVLSHRMGLEVNVPKRVHDALELNTTVSFWVHTQVREDAITLYGFESESEKYLFRALLGVSGLGPKTALSLLSHLSPREVVDHILSKNANGLSSAPGVGKKVAEKILVELTGKIEKMAWISMFYQGAPAPRTAVTTSPSATLGGVREDLASALVHLGYAPNQVKGTLDRLYPDDGTPIAIEFEVGLKTALRELSGRPRAS